MLAITTKMKMDTLNTVSNHVVYSEALKMFLSHTIMNVFNRFAEQRLCIVLLLIWEPKIVA